MQNNIGRKKVFSGFIWRFMERCGAQGVSFVVSVILARLLKPEDYGTIAIVTVMITIMNVFIDSGFGIALIQKKNADDVDFSSVFYFNIVICTILYLLMFFFAPFIAAFYHNSELVPMIRVLSITLIVSGVKNVQQAYVRRNMLFKRFFFSTLGGTVGAAFIGILMAYHGFGVWALVAQSLFNTIIDTIILWFTVGWYPKWVFSLERIKGLFHFGWKLLASGLLDTIYNNMRQLIIGRIYTSSDLAFYNRGESFPIQIVSNITSSIDSVLFPVMSNEQDNISQVRAMTRRAIKVSTYVIAPLMMGLAFTSSIVVRLLLTEKWAPCVFFLRIFCITYMFYPVHTANLNAINALGRSDLFLKLEIAKKIVGAAALLSTMWISVEAMAYSMLAVSVLGQVINSWPNKKLLHYSYVDQMRDIMPAILLAVGMGICVSFVQFFKLPDIVALPVQVVLGAVIYIGGSKVMKLDSFEYILGLVKPLLWRKLPVKEK